MPHVHENIEKRSKARRKKREKKIDARENAVFLSLTKTCSIPYLCSGLLKIASPFGIAPTTRLFSRNFFSGIISFFLFSPFFFSLSTHPCARFFSGMCDPSPSLVLTSTETSSRELRKALINFSLLVILEKIIFHFRRLFFTSKRTRYRNGRDLLFVENGGI